MTTHDAPLTEADLGGIAARVAVHFGLRPRPGLALSCGCAWDYDCPAHSACRLGRDVPHLLAEVRRLRALIERLAPPGESSPWDTVGCWYCGVDFDTPHETECPWVEAQVLQPTLDEPPPPAVR